MDPRPASPRSLEASPSPSTGGAGDNSRRALGRGLAALIPSSSPTAPAPQGPVRIPIEEIQPERGQPRRFVDREKLQELAQSIKTYGVLQPVLVRGGKGGYVLIAGERRWRAAQMAGLREVPAVVREAAADEAFEIALVENIQREDLSPIEEAEAYRRLIGDHGLTQEDLARRVGKDRATIANALRLLRLPDEVKRLITQSELSMGHARALLGIADEAALRRAALEVARNRLSVRATEKLVQRMRSTAAATPSGSDQSAAVRALVESLQRALGTRVRIEEKGGRGKLEVDFGSLDQLDAILARILGPR